MQSRNTSLRASRYSRRAHGYDRQRQAHQPAQQYLRHRHALRAGGSLAGSNSQSVAPWRAGRGRNHAAADRLPGPAVPRQPQRGGRRSCGSIARKAGLHFVSTTAVDDWLPGGKRGVGQQMADELIHRIRLGAILARRSPAGGQSCSPRQASEQLSRLVAELEKAGEDLACGRRRRGPSRDAPAGDRRRCPGPRQACRLGVSWPIRRAAGQALGRSLNHLVSTYLVPRRTFMPWCKVAGLGRPSGSRLFHASSLPRFRLDRLADRLEPRRAAILRLVQIDHRRPRALAGVGGVHIKVIAAGLERVGVRLEFLARRVALALQRLARARAARPSKSADLAVDLADHRIAPVEVAGLARPEIGDPDIVGDFGRATLVVDPLDQRGAGAGVEEIADDEQLELAASARAGRRASRRASPRGPCQRCAAKAGAFSMSCWLMTARTTLFISVIRVGSGTDVFLIITATV